MGAGRNIAKSVVSKAPGWERSFANIAGGEHHHHGLVGPGAVLGIGMQIFDLLEKLGENKGDVTQAHIEMGARALGLSIHDYRSIIDRRGLPNVIGVEGQTWKPHRKDKQHRLSRTQYESFLRNARLVYETSNMSVDRDGRKDFSLDWRLKAQRFEAIDTMDPMDGVHAVYVMPHIAKLALHTMDFTAREINPYGSPFEVVNNHFKRDMDMLKQDPCMVNIGYSSDRIAQELTYVSNDLVALDPVVRESKLPFARLNPDWPEHAGRATLQIFAINYLKAAYARDPYVATLMNDVAYCAWGMLRVGQMKYRDGGSYSDLLRAQWQVADEGPDLIELRIDPEVRRNEIDKLIKQFPDQ